MDSKIRYLGVGAMVIGGVWSLIKLFKPLVEGINASLAALKNQSSNSETPIEEQDMPISYVGIGLVVLLVPVFLLYLGIINSIAIAALLTIVGYSLNDTIVIYDRIRENMKFLYKIPG